jgi:NAD(P)-dependent dehydrogenase (short-subunit alcohol dehydrogenase family)
MGGYSLAKLALTKLTAYVASEHPSITSVSLDPGIVPTDMGRSVPFLAPFMLDTPELVGGAAVWLSSGDKSFLSGRYVSSNWDVEEIELRKDEIVEEDQLKFKIKANYAANATVEMSK